MNNYSYNYSWNAGIQTSAPLINAVVNNALL